MKNRSEYATQPLTFLLLVDAGTCCCQGWECSSQDLGGLFAGQIPKIILEEWHAVGPREHHIDRQADAESRRDLFQTSTDRSCGTSKLIRIGSLHEFLSIHANHGNPGNRWSTSEETTDSAGCEPTKEPAPQAGVTHELAADLE